MVDKTDKKNVEKKIAKDVKGKTSKSKSSESNKTFEKVKSLRGALYRKIAEMSVKKSVEEKGVELKGTKDIEVKDMGKRSADSPLPGFKMKKIKRIAEFPEIEDITKVDIAYPLIEPFVYANIKWSEKNSELVYIVIEPELTDKEKDTMKKISDALIELVEVELTAVKNEGKAMDYLEKEINKIIKEFAIKLTQNQYVKMMYYVYRNFIGFNEIEPFLQDPNIEDISCDGTDTPLYVIHRKFGSLKTNVIIKDVEYLREFIVKLAERCGRYVSYAEPILAGTLPDGSRVSATLAGDVATRGPVFTIRKFSEKPFSPTEQMRLKTSSPEILAYFWYVVEHGASMLIVGGVATGKTSFLNTLCMFIPPEAKIVSIEDTRELRIPNKHWIPSLARTGFGIPMPTGEKYGGVTLFDLLKESFRQNPDYVIVGETRGKEAYVMFQGMSSGHPSMSTFHAGSVDTVIKRLTTPPIELSPTLIESLNVMTIMVHAREKGKSARRIKEVVEVESVDPKTGKVSTNIVYVWDPVTDLHKKMNESKLIKRLVLAKGGTVEEANKKIKQREEILKWMLENDVEDYKQVAEIINRHYKEPERLMEDIRSGRVVARKVKKDEEAVKPLQAPSKHEPLKLTKPKEVLKSPLKAKLQLKTAKSMKKDVRDGKMKEALEGERVSILNLFAFKFLREN